MRVDEYLAALAVDGKQLADAAERRGLDAPTAACPGWRIRDVVAHTGGVHRWAASIVATGRTEPYSQAEEDAFFEVLPDEKLVDWFREGHRALVDTLGTAGPGCWTFFGNDAGSLAFWARRQAHETAVHHYDVDPAGPTWSPEFAIDGIDEILNGFFTRPGKGIPADPPASVALVASDADAAWTIRFHAGGHQTSAGKDQPVRLFVKAEARDLYLLLWNRIELDRLTTKGNDSLWDHWRNNAKVTW
jgi:uncharacterized protein (TIGR03083 family)